MKSEPTTPGDVEKHQDYTGHEDCHEDGIKITLHLKSWLGGKRPEDIFDGQHPCGQSGNSDKKHGNYSDPRVAGLAHVDEKCGANGQGDGGKQLVAGTEERPQSGN